MSKLVRRKNIKPHPDELDIGSTRRKKFLHSEDHWIDWFECEYSRLEREKGLEAAKAFFRQHFLVTCFACGHVGKPVPPMNCAQCGQYLD